MVNLEPDIREDKNKDLVIYALEFDNYCGYEALVTLILIVSLSVQVWSLVEPLDQFKVIFDVFLY